MTELYDAIVIGAGHNGLTCACYLARAGLKVLVLEEYHTVGGMTVTEEITMPGFKSDLHASGYQLANLSPVPQELGLLPHGYELIERDAPFSHVFPDGNAITVNRDVEKSVASLARFSKKDGETWRALMQQFVAAKPAIVASMFSPPPSFAAEAAALAQSPEEMDAYRFSMQSVRSWANQTFESENVKTVFASFASFVGVGPDDAGGAELGWLFAAVLQMAGNYLVRGGMHTVSLALADDFRAHGGVIRTNARVEKILGDARGAAGVRLANGEEIVVGKAVVSNVDPAQLVLQLLGQDMVGAEIVGKMERYEWGDSVMVLYVALDAPIEYKAGAQLRESATVHLTEPSLDFFSRVYMECRGGRLPAEPMIVAWNDSAVDPSRAPAGKALMKFVVLNVPYKIQGDATGKLDGASEGASWDEVRDAYADYLLDLISAKYIPDLKHKVLKRVAHSPVDMERTLRSAVHGTLAHGAFLPYQNGALRPIPELGEYKTPVPNVYLCGSGSHPGPGVSMAAGRNAAHVIYRDLGLDFKKIIGGA